MSSLKACRICLATKVKMYKFDQFQLTYYYEEIMDSEFKFNKRDGLPHYCCYECATLLHKFYKFKKKCTQSHKLLKELLRKGPLNRDRIYDVHCKVAAITSSLDILRVTKRVKTYTIRVHKPEPESDYDEEDNLDLKKIKEKEEKANQEIKEDSFVKVDEPEDYNMFEYKPVLSGDEMDITYDDNDAHDDDVNDIDEGPSDLSLPSAPIAVEPLPVVVPSSSKKEKKSSESKTSKDKAVAMAKPKKTYKFNKPKKKPTESFLNSNHWRKSLLSEEEALKQFKARADDPKYPLWAYKCSDCIKGFRKEDIYKRHRLLRHNEAYTIVCHFCKMSFKRNFQLGKHVRLHYTKYECLRCDLVCSSETSADMHEEFHNGVIRTCPHCNRQFRHLSTYYTHLRTHRSQHMCSLCGDSFVSELGLSKHMKTKHLSHLNNPELAMKNSDDVVYCEVCKITFRTKEAYDNHLAHSAMHIDQNKTYPVLEDIVKDDIISQAINDKPKDQNSKPKLGENLCAVRKRDLPKTFSRIGHSKPTTCYICGEHFKTQQAYTKHHNAQHPRTSLYSPSERVVCEICGARVAPGSVAAHVNQHTRSKMYTCDTCGRSFTTNNMLKNHLVVHTGEKPFECSLCEKRFTQNGSLSLHYRTIHLKKPYKRNRRKKVDEISSEHGQEVFMTSPFM